MTKMLIPRMTTSDDHHPGNGKNTDKKNCAQESVSTVQGFLRCEDRPTCSVCYFSTVIFIILPDNFNKWHKIFVSLHLALAFTTLNFHFCSSLHNIALTGDSVLSRTCMSRLGVRILQRTVLLVRWRFEVRIFTQCQNICSLFFPVYQASTDKILREDQPQMRLIRKTGMFDLDLRLLKPICISSVRKIPFRTK